MSNIPQELASLIIHRLDRAEEALQEAELLLEAGHYNATVNRTYYACFYAVSALLLTENLSSSKHSGIRSLFSQHWVKKGRLPRELGSFYKLIFDCRQKGDYADLAFFSREEASNLLMEARNFVKKITEVTYMQIQGGNCL